jgi:hypothetical protein
MKKALLTMAAFGAIAAATPAAAQYANSNAGGGVGISNRIVNLEARIDAGIRAGTIDRTEAARLRSELWELRRLETRYGRNGLSASERTELQARIRDLREDIRLASGLSVGSDRYVDRDDDGIRYDRYGRRDDRYGEYDRNGNRIGRTGDTSYGRHDDGIRYDRYGRRDDRYGEYDRNGNRIGRSDGGYSGQGGPYEDEDYNEQCRDRGGLGGLINGVLGRDGCGSTLRVGARATSNLRVLPSEYRYRYRDGNGVYYRHDGRAIYQIDARTETVIRVYPMNN